MFSVSAFIFGRVANTGMWVGYDWRAHKFAHALCCAQPSFRYLTDNKFTGSVETLGTLAKLKEL